MLTSSFIIRSALEMEELGSRIGAKLKIGEVVLLKGELGAGKTTLTRGIGRALGATEVSSPTFVISRRYSGVIPLVHVDAYRLLGNELALFDDLDLESLIPHSITVIEWGAGLIDRLGLAYLTVDIDFGDDADERLVKITGLSL
jgi:tRNA threonylcarbamoyladenosine biosynthesis protein TsaE